MKTVYGCPQFNRLANAAVCLAVLLLIAPHSRAGFILEMNVIRYDQNAWYFAPNLVTNTTAPNVPFGFYNIMSHDYPTNGAGTLYQYDTNGFNGIAEGPYGYGDFNSMVYELTNGTWSIFVTNSVMTNVYHFTVVLNLVSNDLPAVTVTFPPNGATAVTNQPVFTWQGSTNYSDLVVYEANNSAGLPVTQTNWPSPSTLLQGLNTFTVHYDYYSTTGVIASVPLDAGSHPIASWMSTTHLQDYISSTFTVGTADTSGTAHTLVAHYPFDATSGPVLAATGDTSGNGYDMSYSGSYGAEGGVNLTADAAAGIGAVQFNDGDGNSAGYLGWTNPTPPALLSALAGSFTVSCWIKTTQNNLGWDQAPAYYGAGIVAADNFGLANDVVPMALTGGTIGFNTGGSIEDDTLNSTASVNDGNYHHVVVTRNQQTAQKIIYIDGAFDSFSSGTTNLLDDPQKLTIGALANAGNPDPNDGSYYNGYNGELDDLQIYSGVLSAGEVANLFANPGTIAANGGGNYSGGHTNIAHYAFDNSGFLGQDTSGNGNDMDGVSWWGPVQQFTNEAEAGPGAVQFFGTSCLTPDDSVLTNWDAVLGGSFTISAWVNTTNAVGNPSDDAVNGATLFWAYDDHNNTNDTIPIALTGGYAAFSTRDHLGNGTTLHSTTSVNDGNYHLITVTRDQSSGQKSLYVDGNLQATEIGTTEPLNGNNYFLSLGGTTISSYTGLADDVQIYSGVLSATEVAYLYANPGQTVSNKLATSGIDFNGALGTSNLSWSTSGDTSWFVETTNTYNGSPSAAQSGSVTNEQSSTLAVTVTGPGTLSFYWASQDDCNNFDYEFDMDGSYEDDISCDAPWSQFGPFAIPSGQHTLTWTTYADGDTDPTEAGFLDQVSYVTVPSLSVTASPSSGPAPLTVQFSSPGVDSAGNTVTNWNWSFGDGGTSTAQSPSYTYNSAGSFSPSLTAYSTYGATPLTVTGLGVIMVTNAAPSITVNPFNQTNYPGYNVALYAAATSSPAATWQWFKTGAGLIAGATNNLYIPTNSGTAGVAGNYYAIASNLVGSANTLTAAVTFATAPLPPDWTLAFKSPLGNSFTNATTNYNIACVLDSTGNLYTAGSVSGTNTFGSNSLISINGQSGASILKQTPAGAPIWGLCLTNNGNGSSYAQCVVIGPSNGCYVSGEIFGTNWLGTNLLVDIAGGSTFVARFDASGNILWVRTVSGTNGNFSEYHRLVSDPAGNVTISILISGYTSLGATNVFVAGQGGTLVQYDASGNVRWWQVPSSWPAYLTYQGGRIYGSMGGNGGFGGNSINYIGGLTNVSPRGEALFSLNATNGQAYWIQGLGGLLGVGDPGGFSDQDAVVAVSGTNVFVAGSAWGSNAVCGPFALTFPAAKGQYIARYDTNGNPQAAKSFGSQFTWPWSIAADASGNVYVGGDFDTYSFFGNDLIAAPFYQTVQYIDNNINDRIPGQGFIAKFDLNGNPLWARLAESQSSFLNNRDIALASDGVWCCGFFNQIATFGPTNIGSSATLVGSPIGTVVFHPDGYLAKVTVSASPLPVTLLNPQIVGANFQCQFVSQSGFNHGILYRTNLVAGAWQTNSTIAGDGTLKTVTIPLSAFNPATQGYIRVSTQ